MPKFPKKLKKIQENLKFPIHPKICQKAQMCQKFQKS